MGRCSSGNRELEVDLLLGIFGVNPRWRVVQKVRRPRIRRDGDGVALSASCRTLGFPHLFAKFLKTHICLRRTRFQKVRQAIACCDPRNGDISITIQERRVSV